jgi:DNA-binding NtrC family response regulator
MKIIPFNENIHCAQLGRVMVVDDHREARESMAEALRSAGHEVVCCSSAPEALQVLEREDFDCVLTDLKMPGMNGVEFIVQLEQRRLSAATVMVTAYATVATAVEAMRHGAFDYIEKPFGADQLERLVGQAIRHSRLVRLDVRGPARARNWWPAPSTPPATAATRNWSA